MANPKIAKDIGEAKDIIKEVMQENLYLLADNVIQEIMKNFRKLSQSEELKAIKDISDKGLPLYKKDLLTTLTVIAGDALKKVRKEVPAASKIELKECNEIQEKLICFGDFSSLPPKLKNKIKSKADLIVETQKNDLDKSIAFQFSSSYDSTDSDSVIEKDLYDASEKFIDGVSVNAGSDVAASATINDARETFLFDDQVKDELDALMFCNDDPVTDICIDLSNNGEGQIFDMNDPEVFRFTPPLHFNCKSYLVPVLKGDADLSEIETLKPSSTELENQIQF